LGNEREECWPRRPVLHSRRPFPEPVEAVQKMGAKPGNIQIVGDSAGGTLIHETLSHFRHPVARLVDEDRNHLYGNDNDGDW